MTAQSNHLGAFTAELQQQAPAARLDLGTAAGNGLAKLALSLIELLRQLLERQAIRRVESGSLSNEEIERLGTTFMRLAQQMETLKQTFGLTQDDLNLDLGPIGKLL